MDGLPVAGRQALYLQMLGESLASATQEGQAPNQHASAMLPPELAPRARGPAADAPEGQRGMRMAYGPRLMGANSIAVRASAAERGITDPRVASIERVKLHNRMSGEGDRQPLRKGPEGEEPQPVILVSHKAVPIQAVHAKDGRGYSENGEHQLVPVKAGDPVRGPDGKPVHHVHELKDIYKAYHLEDMNMAGVGERRPPFSSARATAQQNQEFAERCADQGIPARTPNPEERHKLVVETGIERMVESALRYAEARGAPFVLETKENISEAKFTATTHPPTVEYPEATAEGNVDERASSIARAVSEAALFASLSERASPVEVARIGPDGMPGAIERQLPASQLVQRVEAHAAPRPSYLDQAHLDRASLVASYAALNTVTAMGATYSPGPDAEDPRVRTAWARELNRIGGMEDLSQELTEIERGLARKPGGGGDWPRRRELIRAPERRGESNDGPPRERERADERDGNDRPTAPKRRPAPDAEFPGDDRPVKPGPVPTGPPAKLPITPDGPTRQTRRPQAPTLTGEDRVPVRPGGNPDITAPAPRPAPERPPGATPRHNRNNGQQR